MGIHTAWQDDSQSTIYMQFEPEWNWEDLYAALEQADTLLVSVPHRVDLIIDLRDGLRIPGDFKTIARDLLANPEPRPNEGTKVVIGANGFMKMLYNGMRKLYAHKLGERGLLFAGSLEEAAAMIAQSRLNGSNGH